MKHFAKEILIGILLSFFYLIIRLYLTKNHSIGDFSEGARNYFSLNPFKVIQNLLLLIGNAFTSIDTIDLFLFLRFKTGNILLLLLTIALNIPFIILLLSSIYSRIKKNEEKYKIFLLLFIIIIMALPHTLTKTWEMHVYPLVFFVALLFGIVFNNGGWTKSYKLLVILLFFLSTIIVDIYKWYNMYEFANSGENIAKNIFNQSKEKPDSVLLIYVDYGKGYGTFRNQPVVAFGHGRGMLPYYNYKGFNKVENISIDHSEKNIKVKIDSIVMTKGKAFDVVWIIDSLKVTVIPSGGLRK